MSTPASNYRITLSHHNGLGGIRWCGVTQRDAGHVWGTQNTERAGSSRDALVASLSKLGYNPTPEQDAELGRDCGIADQGVNSEWVVELESSGNEWRATVRDGRQNPIGEATSADPYEALIRALDGAVTSRAYMVDAQGNFRNKDGRRVDATGTIID